MPIRATVATDVLFVKARHNPMQQSAALVYVAGMGRSTSNLPVRAEAATDVLFAKARQNSMQQSAALEAATGMGGSRPNPPVRAEAAAALFAKLRNNPGNGLPHQSLPLASAIRGPAMPTRAEVPPTRFSRNCATTLATVCRTKACCWHRPVEARPCR
jgi:hypothetical protein